jgi:hypothetical protein
VSGFSVDLAELAAVAGRARSLADDVRDDAVWTFAIDVANWPADDPVRAAVERYQRSLRAAVWRVCAKADATAEDLDATAAAYRRADDDVRAALGELG